MSPKSSTTVPRTSPSVPVDQPSLAQRPRENLLAGSPMGSGTARSVSSSSWAVRRLPSVSAQPSRCLGWGGHVRRLCLGATPDVSPLVGQCGVLVNPDHQVTVLRQPGPKGEAPLLLTPAIGGRSGSNFTTSFLSRSRLWNAASLLSLSADMPSPVPPVANHSPRSRIRLYGDEWLCCSETDQRQCARKTISRAVRRRHRSASPSSRAGV